MCALVEGKRSVAKEGSISVLEQSKGISCAPAIDPVHNKFLELKATKDSNIREALICYYIPLVNRIARRSAFLHRESFEDLAQVGYIGLIKAVDNFDPNKDVKFITYATHQIFGEIRHYLRDKVLPIKAPRWLSQLNRSMAQSLNVLTQQLKRLPTVAELSKEMNITEEGLLEVLKMNHLISSKSMDDVENSKELIGKIEKIRAREYKNFQLPVEDKISVQQAIETLAPVARRVIYLFFYYDLTQSEIGDKLGISQRQVSRVIYRSLDKLKNLLFKELW